MQFTLDYRIGNLEHAAAKTGDPIATSDQDLFDVASQFNGMEFTTNQRFVFQDLASAAQNAKFLCMYVLRPQKKMG